MSLRVSAAFHCSCCAVSPTLSSYSFDSALISVEMQPFNLNFCLGKMTKLQGAKPHEQSEWLATIVLIRTEQQQNLKCGLLATGIHCVCGKSPPSDTSKYRIESHC